MNRNFLSVGVLLALTPQMDGHDHVRTPPRIVARLAQLWRELAPRLHRPRAHQPLHRPAHPGHVLVVNKVVRVVVHVRPAPHEQRQLEPVLDDAEDEAESFDAR